MKKISYKFKLKEKFQCNICGQENYSKSMLARDCVNHGFYGFYKECSFCQCLIVDHHIDYESLYKDRSSTNYSENIQGKLKNLKSIYLKHTIGRRIEKYQCNSILDYGCGSGELSNALAKLGYSVTATDVQKTRPLGLDYNINYINIDDIKGSKKFDLIIMRHVLEHISDPFNELEILKSNLNKKSYILIEVPNGDSPFRLIFKSYWSGYYFPFHVYTFNKKSLKFLAKKLNLEIAELKNLNSFTLGMTLIELGFSRNVARIGAFIFSPIQWVISFLFRRGDSLLLVLKNDD